MLWSIYFMLTTINRSHCDSTVQIQLTAAPTLLLPCKFARMHIQSYTHETYTQVLFYTKHSIVRQRISTFYYPSIRLFV